MKKRYVALCFLLGACTGGDVTGVITPPEISLGVQEVASGFSNPLFVISPPGDTRLFVVEQDRFEEVDVVESHAKGVNYGWNIMEGSSCFATTSCNQTGLEFPPLVYDHSNGGCSITGGYVYRGSIITDLIGHYFYSDYCAGFLKSFRYQNGRATEERTYTIGSIGSITSFGQDASGELYMTSSNGKVYRIIQTG